MAGVGVSIGLAMTYLGRGTLFEQMGNVGYLQPDVAAWAPDTLFSLTGLYLLLRMRARIDFVICYSPGFLGCRFRYDR